ncbi:MAG: tetratricopeptide repeat protein [Flavobacteriales bacterium]
MNLRPLIPSIFQAILVAWLFGCIGIICPSWCVAQSTSSDNELYAETTLMLDRGDSLLRIDKPVAALAMYRGAEERSFDPCHIARARIGIARIYTDSQNPELALEALEAAQSGFLACDASIRRIMTLTASEIWVELNQESKAIELVQQELNLRDDDLELSARLADLWFTGGHWDQARHQYQVCLNRVNEGDFNLRSKWTSALIQINAAQNQPTSDSLIHHFESLTSNLSIEEAQSHREQIHLVLTMQNSHVQGLKWAKSILAHTDSSDQAMLAVAHLRIANSAQLAHRPLDAMIGFHEAIKAARESDDAQLLAEVLRQKGLFEKERGNQEDALEAFFELDQINSRLLAQLNKTSRNDPKQFSEEVMPELDPFDQAVLAASRAHHSSQHSSEWPWIAGILAIGLLAYARKQKQLKKILHRERRRIIRLRSLVPSDRLPNNAPARKIESDEQQEWGDTSLMPNGEILFTQDTIQESQSIALFLEALDEDLRSRIEYDLNGKTPISIGPEVRVVIRNLLRGVTEMTSSDSRIRIDFENASADGQWKLSLHSQNQVASRALEGLFYGKDALASSRWNELHSQLRKLAGKINVERLSPIEERLTVTLPKA